MENYKLIHLTYKPMPHYFANVIFKQFSTVVSIEQLTFEKFSSIPTIFIVLNSKKCHSVAYITASVQSAQRETSLFN